MVRRLAARHEEGLAVAVALRVGLDSAALEVERILEEKGIRNGSNLQGRIHVYVSDVPYLIKEVGERFLGRPIERIERVSFQ